MITSDAGLEMTREQLQRAERILEGYRRDLLPHNPVQYHLFTGSTIDLIRSLRAEIEAYLGIGTDTDLTVSLEGEDVYFGMTSAGIITRTIDTFRRGLQAVVRVLHSHAGRNGAARPADWVERLCDLSLVGLGPGSVQVFLDLPAMGDGLFAEEDRRLLKEAVTTLFDSLEWAAQEDEAVPPSLDRLAPATRLSLLGVVTRLLPPQTGPVERIAYRRRADATTPTTRRATLTRESRRRVHGEMERLAADRKFTEAEGVIRQIDLDAQSFILRERPDNQADLPCEYSDTLAETAKELLDCRVKVSGLLETSRLTHRSKMEAEAIEPLGCEDEIVPQVECASGPA